MNRARVLAFLRLLRIPNVFTAIADVLMGYWITSASLGVTINGQLVLLLVSSCSLYLSGMVWNDVFDIEIDRVERPMRPLPSSVFSRAFAVRLGAGLMLAGLLAAGLAGYSSLAVALAIMVAIFAYDGWLKNTFAGPAAMGLCRALNVLLGMSHALTWFGPAAGSATIPPALWLVPVANGVYILGVTVFAKREATGGTSTGQAIAAMVILLGLGGHAWVFAKISAAFYAWLATGVFLVYIGVPLIRAIAEPVPNRMQAAIKSCLLGLIPLDAAIALAVSGPIAAAAILLLLIPALFVGRWVYST